MGALVRRSGMWGRRSARATRWLAWAVAGVFLVAAAAKTLDLPGLRAAVEATGWVPAGLAGAVALLVLAAELFVGMGLIHSPTRPRAAIAGALLAGAFAAVTLSKLSHGVREDCACFGLLLPLSPVDTLRLDLALLAACLLVLVAPWAGDLGDRAPGASTRRAIAFPARWARYALLWAALILALHTIGQRRWAQARAAEASGPSLHRLEPGRPIPTALSSALQPEGGVRPPALRLVIFANPACSSCRRPLRAVADASRTWRGEVAASVVVPVWERSRRPDAEAQGYLRRIGVRLTALPDRGYELTEQCLDEPQTWPFAVLVDPVGTVVAIARPGDASLGDLVDAIPDMLGDVPFELGTNRSVWYGRRVSDRIVATQRGAVRLSALWRERPVVVTVVDPGCGTCREQLRSLRSLRTQPPLAELVCVVPNDATAQVAPEAPPGCVITEQGDLARHSLGLSTGGLAVIAGGRLKLLSPRPVPQADLRRAIEGAAADDAARFGPTQC